MERKRLVDENVRLRAEQEARDQRVKFDAWRTLAARSAHRIGNQIFSSLGAVRTLKKVEQAEAVEAVSDLEACMDRIRMIVQEFQTFSRNEQPRLLPRDIGPLLGDIVRRYSGLAQNVQFSADVPESLPACLLDRDQIDQALGELLENALHYTPAGGRIRVVAEAIGQKVRIAIEDTGPGIPDSDKDRIFEAFFSRSPGGSGLGLAIVKQIVENHGGTIRETGKAGSGARFEIDLPAQSSKES
jgi:signal transduction histidine kinase